MADILTLRGDYGYTDFNLRNDDVDVIDASNASWTLANLGGQINRYPFQVVNNDPGVRIIGGTVNGKVSMTLDWRDAYENSAAVRVEDTRLATIEDWRITNAWDGIRVNGSSEGFKIDNVWLSNIRDDAVENDVGMSGTISNSLFEDVFVGLSMASRDGPNRSSEVVTIDNVMIGMKSYSYKGSDTHMSPFKIYSTSPKMEIHDTIIAIEDVTHHGISALERAWDKVISSSGNYLLNLSDTPLPSNYPMPKSGFTILQGQEARAFWNAERKEWIADQGSPDAQPEPVATENAETAPEESAPVKSAPQEPEKASASEVTVTQLVSFDGEQSGTRSFDTDQAGSDDDLEIGAGDRTSLVFEDVAIATGAAIASASLTLTSQRDQGGAADLEIRLFYDADAIASSGDDVLTDRGFDTFDFVPFEVRDSWSNGQKIDTPDLSGLIQDLIDTDPQADGTYDLSFSLASSNGIRRIDAEEFGDDIAAELTLVYSTDLV